MEFPERLREALDKQGVSIYRLSRLLDPENPSRAERNIYKWLAGSHEPSEANRRNLAAVLGLSPDFFVDTDRQLDRDLAEFAAVIARNVRDRKSRV